MSDALFDLDPVPPPEPAPTLSAGQRLTIRNSNSLARGIHPATGQRLAGNGEACATCAHHVVNDFHKCAKHRLGMSGSSASDIRVTWPACAPVGGSVNKAAMLRRENARFGRRFVDIDVTGTTATRAIRNRDWLIQFFDDDGTTRLSICRAKLDPTGTRWADGITWDELQWLKAEAGFGDAWAVEVFPPDDLVVNVANMRHLWVLPTAPDYGWGHR